MVNTVLLYKKIEESGKKKSYLADKLGISTQAFRLKCLNKNEFLSSQVDILCKELDITSLSEKEEIFFARFVEEYATIGAEDDD